MNAVEVHRVRPVEGRVEIPEVDEDRVTDARVDERPLDARVAGRVRDRLREVACELAVDDRPERRLGGRELHVLDRVVAVRDDIPADRNGRDPDLDEMLGRSRSLLRAGHDGMRRHDADRERRCREGEGQEREHS